MLCQRLVENRLLLYRPLFLLFHSHSSVFFSSRVFGAKFNRTTHSIHHVLLLLFIGELSASSNSSTYCAEYISRDKKRNT